MIIPVTIIVLTFNEEKNIVDCLETIKDFCDEIIVVDSGSTDKTLEIVKQYTEKVFHHPFVNYSEQRNWALENLPIKNDWILNLDADHRVTDELKKELTDLFSKGVSEEVNGFLISRRTIFMGRWIKHGGHYPTYHANMFRKGFGKCEEKLYDQHYLVEGKLLKLKGDIIDIITDSLSTFITRHNKWSTLEAEYQMSNKNEEKVVKANLMGHPIQKRRALKKFYEKFPLFVRPTLYFIQRYFLRLGFLDGKEGLIFHFLQGFWFRFLIDAKIWEMRNEKS
ncbi:MAG: glycosyltransferase family 2 protein [Ignavibacterium album]|uniref:glycosyltransferase family 2 protein n=1 Tax=Ignavibacterium album TaxID=591197 RepID=UPI0026E977B9|nr:glycosyltransferase family 2 protein [Ignavibacterium album]MCX8104702.1 glycosyltransferase family 2 protein [Ignavibacterium album]